MKTIFILTFTICTIISCKAQKLPVPQIIPIEEVINYMNNDAEMPDGIYFKDINQLLNKYVGTWIGAYENKVYEIQITEFTDKYLGITEDILLVRYKITDSNGNVIANTLSLPNDAQHVISGWYLSANKANYVLNYSSIEECEQSGVIYINTVNNETQMNLVLLPNSEYMGCPNGVKESIFPVAGEGYVELTKK